jgi:hypothetical protein
MTNISVEYSKLKKVRESLDYSSGLLVKDFRVSTRGSDTSKRASRECPLRVRSSSASDINFDIKVEALSLERELVTSSDTPREGLLGICSTQSYLEVTQ